MSALRLDRLPELHGRAADGSVVSYPLSQDAAIYRKVRIAAHGEWNASLPNGGTWRATPELFDSFVASYDPEFYAATINTDHQDRWGPAQGLILALYHEGKYLLADIAITDPWLAWQVERGQWPHRSIEWWQESILGAKFYERFPDYIMGLGLLGVRSPAVPELGPVPPREVLPGPDLIEFPAIPYVNPLAASALRREALRIIPQEGPMKPEAGGSPAPPNNPPPEESPELAALKAQLAERDSEISALKAAQAAPPPSDDTAQLKAAMAAQKAETASLKAQLRAADIDKAVSAKAAKGDLYATQEAAYRELLELCDGAQAVRLGAELQVEVKGNRIVELVDSLLANQPRLSSEPLAAPQSAPAGQAQGGARPLSAEHKQIARDLGLSEEEYSAQLSGRPAAAAGGAK